jgi:ferrochelatase
MTPHLLLVNLGTPTAPTPEAVREFLEESLSDPSVVDLPAWLWRPILRTMVLRRRPARVAALDVTRRMRSLDRAQCDHVHG